MLLSNISYWDLHEESAAANIAAAATNLKILLILSSYQILRNQELFGIEGSPAT